MSVREDNAARAYDTKISRLETIEIEKIDAEIVIKTLAIETLAIEAINIETINIEAINIEAIKIEAIDIEAIDIEAIDIEILDIERIDQTPHTKTLAARSVIKPVVLTQEGTGFEAKPSPAASRKGKTKAAGGSFVCQRQDLEALHKQYIAALHSGDLDVIRALLTDDVQVFDAIIGRRYAGRSDAETAIAGAMPMLKGAFHTCGSSNDEDEDVKCKIKTTDRNETRLLCSATAMGVSVRIGSRVVWEGLKMVVVESMVDPAPGWEDGA